jgi:LmbE family N-acetylglucosaminyl deacetylase
LTSSSVIASAGKDAASALAEVIWSAAFALAGRVVRPPVRTWSTRGGQRVLVLIPHPDDEAIGCAGTVMRHARAGDEVHLVYVSDGRRSRALGLDPVEMARRRCLEAHACAAALGTDRVHWLGLREGEWSVRELLAPLAVLVDRVAPDFVYAPSRVDFHREHHRVAHALAQVLSASRAPIPAVRIYQIHVPLTPILINLVNDVSDVTDAIAAAGAAYTTQRTSVARTDRQRRYAARTYGIGRLAEAFWEVAGERYARLHGEPVERWATDVFRGIRARAVSDPWAYVRGTFERRRLGDRSR